MIELDHRDLKALVMGMLLGGDKLLMDGLKVLPSGQRLHAHMGDISRLAGAIIYSTRNPDA